MKVNMVEPVAVILVAVGSVSTCRIKCKEYVDYTRIRVCVNKLVTIMVMERVAAVDSKAMRSPFVTTLS